MSSRDTICHVNKINFPEFLHTRENKFMETVLRKTGKSPGVNCRIVPSGKKSGFALYVKVTLFVYSHFKTYANLKINTANN